MSRQREIVLLVAGPDRDAWKPFEARRYLRGQEGDLNLESMPKEVEEGMKDGAVMRLRIKKKDEIG